MTMASQLAVQILLDGGFNDTAALSSDPPEIDMPDPPFESVVLSMRTCKYWKMHDFCVLVNK